jgi:hypothetical protein
LNHSFNVNHAIEYGIEEAIIINNFIYWISANKTNNTNKHNIEINGEKVARTFTYDSIDEYAKLFPYMKSTTIRNCINKLIDKGVLAKGHYNSNTYVRTLWYCFVDEDKFLSNASDNNNKSISQYYQMEVTKVTNRIDESNKSCYKYKPDINTNINTDVNTKTENKNSPLPSMPELDNFIPEGKLDEYINTWKKQIPGYKPAFGYSEKQAIRTMLNNGYKIEDVPAILTKLKTIKESNHKEADFYKPHAISLSLLLGKNFEGKLLNSLDDVYETVTKKPAVTEKSIKETFLISEYQVYDKNKIEILKESYEECNMIFDEPTQKVFCPDGTVIEFNTYAKNWGEYDRKYENYQGDKIYANKQ